VNTSEKLLVVTAVCVLMAGCVSTTTSTGSSGQSDAKADPADAAELNYQLGARYYRNGSYELARDRLLGSIKLDPKNAIAHYTLALTYEKLGNLRLATESYENAVRVAPNDYNVQNAYAVFLCNQRQFEDARKQFDRAIKVRENDTSEITMTNAGVCMMQQPDVVAAEEYFRAALMRKSNYGEALIQMSLLKFSTEDYLSARAFLQRYLSTNVATSGVLYLGVRIEERLGDDRAKTDYSNQILRDFPQSPEARRILASGS
jgi:type IV pilus assembly protein PilF